MPYAYDKITTSVFAPNKYKNIQTDLYQIAFPTTNYLSNNWFLGNRTFNYASETTDAQMRKIKEVRKYAVPKGRTFIIDGKLSDN